MKEIFIIVAVILVVIAVVAYTKNEKVKAFFHKEETVKALKELIVKAENEIVGTKRGQDRLKMVVKEFYDKFVPANLAKIITEDMVVNAVNEIFKQIAVVCEDGTVKAVA